MHSWWTTYILYSYLYSCIFLNILYIYASKEVDNTCICVGINLYLIVHQRICAEIKIIEFVEFSIFTWLWKLKRLMLGTIEVSIQKPISSTSGMPTTNINTTVSAEHGPIKFSELWSWNRGKLLQCDCKYDILSWNCESKRSMCWCHCNLRLNC